MITTGFFELDALMDGGIDIGELGIISAGVGVGKSHFLVHLGCSAMGLNRKVWHVTLELGKSHVERRYESCISGTKLDLCPDYDGVQRKKEKLLRVSEYPATKLSFDMLSADLDKLRNSGFNPDVLIIDSPELMQPTNNHVHLELRNFGKEHDLSIWGSSQLRRSEDVIDTFSKSFTFADFVFKIRRTEGAGISRTAELLIDKNRRGLDHIRIPFRNVDLSISRFEVDSDN